MTYNMLMGTLNPTHSLTHFSAQVNVARCECPCNARQSGVSMRVDRHQTGQRLVQSLSTTIPRAIVRVLILSCRTLILIWRPARRCVIGNQCYCWTAGVTIGSLI